MKLVIVESPTKAKTISRFLGDNFNAISSYGHIRDLPKSTLGVDVENDFEPEYVIPERAKKAVTKLKKKTKKANEIILATDEDREGEAIAWHIVQALDLEKREIKRIVFHEITKGAIEKALKKPRSIDMNLVNAQQARRILDRLVGYTLSPLLWKKVMRGLSAGRVQSVAVRLVVERERERDAFEPKKYWSITADVKTAAKAGQAEKDEVFEAELWKRDEKTIKDKELDEKDEVDDILKTLRKNTSWQVQEVKRKEKKRYAKPPFTTSTLQQAANHRLGFSAKQTMMFAQQLYEGVELDKGHEGLITYMRTDSTNISKQSIAAAKKYITKTFEKNYSAPKNFKTKNKGAQEAHEAIRPTDPTRAPESLKKQLTPRQLKLYRLIWQRFIASQMAPAVFDATTVVIDTDTTYTFRAKGLVQKFDGFLRVWPSKTKEEELPELEAEQKLTAEKITSQEHETKPPARYSEATLVKELEKHGIGRPSTYAPILSTIQDRGYVEKEGRYFFPTTVAGVVTDLLVEHFPSIVDIDFTAKMEKSLDYIAEGTQEWVPVIEAFWDPFEKRVEEKEESLSRTEVVSLRELGTDEKTGKPITVRIGRYGPYVQRGDKDDEEKPKFASIPPSYDIESITKEQAQKLLALPRELGKTKEGKKIEAGIGRYGPFIKIGKDYTSLPTKYDPLTVTLEDAKAVIKEAEKQKEKDTFKEFKKEGIKVLNGRYGPYVTDGESNASIPKSKDPEKITLKEAKEMLEKKKGKGKKKGKKKKSNK